MKCPDFKSQPVGIPSYDRKLTQKAALSRCAGNLSKWALEKSRPRTPVANATLFVASI